MDYRLKAALFRSIEHIPCQDKLYYFFQKHITKSLKPSDTRFIDAFSRKVLKHFTSINYYGKVPMDESNFFEFGAGWDLLAPIGFSLLGGYIITFVLI